MYNRGLFIYTCWWGCCICCSFWLEDS